MLVRQNTQFALFHGQVSPEATIRVRHVSFRKPDPEAQNALAFPTPRTPATKGLIFSYLPGNVPESFTEIVPEAGKANGFTVAVLSDPTCPKRNLIVACVCSAKDHFSRKKGHRKLVNRIYEFLKEANAKDVC